ncbi:Bug family tripartite tricarboxylate transporter substrate binding protein [Advenella mimigardefordensis]|uniref:Bug-like extracytoplasmic solute binding receptor TctC n=1 Tax=Advenella mimigardefordensis (strain DSM 17166 / LMG 22922 / DPN7) TaxID=1247726 RepID=W0PHL9_ADVMD|nr:tripartite tricarboxylate transporter substrate binding protein [Advenella mimigardefordensis]AHG66001.1 Bug-like extracytoplasmic solute binding receptor TctC [Advenella mimigardefordensis DPN7]
MNKRNMLKGLLGLTLAMGAGLAHAAYPERPITMIVPWGAGGGTDATARMIAALLEKELDNPVNVVNRTGGNGVVGHMAIAKAKPDGYTLGMLTVEIATMKHLGLTTITPADYTPLALMNEDPAGVTVSATSEYKDMKSLMDAIKANPGKLKASGTGQGGIWHIAIAGLVNKAGLPPNAVPFVPSNGSAPAMLELVAGGIAIVPTSLPEARSMIDAGKAKPLAIMSKERSPMYPDVPTLKETTGNDWTVGVWRGIAGPKGMPDDVTAKLEAALKKVNESAEFRDFMSKRGFGVAYANSKDYGEYMAKSTADFGEVLKAIGMAK